MQTTFTVTPIGIIRSCFTEKFGIPRQPRLVRAAKATLEVFSPYDRDEAFKDLETFSHLWLVFVFHAMGKAKWRPTVRPPRLGGNRRTGVFATRSGFRPNPIGMSAVVLEGVARRKGVLRLALSGIDVLDQTPVLDIKPYVPYADCIPEAVGGFAPAAPRPLPPVAFSEGARQTCQAVEARYPGFTELLVQVLRTDPRPAYLRKRAECDEFGLRLYDVNIRWSVKGKAITIQTVERRPSATSNEGPASPVRPG